MRQGAVIRVPTSYEHVERVHRILWQPSRHKEVSVHNACLCNEVISLRNRVLFDTPVPDRSFVEHAKRVAHRIALYVGKHQPADGDWIRNYTGKKRTIYENAREDLITVPFCKGKDRYVKSFIKMEKVFDPEKDPRMIQARNPRFNYLLGNYLKPIEHIIYNMKGKRQLRKIFPPTRCIAKCLDLRTRAQLLKRKFESIPNAICYSLDASRFDAHVNPSLLNLEHSIYKYCYSNDRLLQQLLSCQLLNRGVTSNGVRYRCPGGRMSGDMNTALGNCLLMCIIVATCMRIMGFRAGEWEMFCDGDDTLVIINANRSQLFEQNFSNLFNRAGMNMKLENKSNKISGIKFCQGCVINTADGAKFVSDPDRTLSRALISTRHFQHPKSIGPLLRQIGLCELAIHCGVPILQEFALAMLRNAGNAQIHKIQPSGRLIKAKRELYAHGGKIDPLPITMDARLDFEEAFGIETWEQHQLEAELRGAVF
uniref:RNA-directed RNA polymerase n=1 Tax=Juruaca virus TaxID=3229021 RepID=A0AAU7YFW8_9VIRU